MDFVFLDELVSADRTRVTEGQRCIVDFSNQRPPDTLKMVSLYTMGKSYLLDDSNTPTCASVEFELALGKLPLKSGFSTKRRIVYCDVSKQRQQIQGR